MVVRCRPGTVTNSEYGTVPDQRCTARARALALHRIRDTRNCMAPIHSPSNADEPLRREGYHIARWLWGRGLRYIGTKPLESGVRNSR